MSQCCEKRAGEGRERETRAILLQVAAVLLCCESSPTSHFLEGDSDLIVTPIHSSAIAPCQKLSIFDTDSLIPAFVALSIRCHPKAKRNVGDKPRAHAEATQQVPVQNGEFNTLSAPAEESTLNRGFKKMLLKNRPEAERKEQEK